ncbi:MAG: Gfo/Idh/MocA family oxidoreductase [Cytophagales bacterium]|nr:Gfo/Idh/MocA family oxidoreductase [Cytophagales bacterium]
MSHSRRSFVLQSSKIALGSVIASALPLEAVFAHRKRVSPNDRLQVGLIGGNGMGWVNLTSHLKLAEVDCTALCDVDDNVLNKRAAELEKASGKKATLYKDYRKLLEDKALDAVIIGTPDHWHCLQTIHALEAGKHVYVEKPLASSIGECQAMVAAQRRYGKVVQVGQWQRSNKHWQEAIAYVHEGKLGRVRAAKSWIYVGWKSKLPVKPDEAVPAGLDYDLWLGPAPKRPFNPNRFHGSFRYFWDYAGGLMTDWGVHLLDMALHGMKAGVPKSVMSIGGKYAFPEDAMQTPDTQTAVYDYGDFMLAWEHTVGIQTAPYGRAHGVAFIGENGTLVVDRDQWMVLPEPDGKRYRTESVPVQKSSDNGLDNHTANFVDCIKNPGKTPNCSIETGSLAAVVSHMGNVAYRTGRKVYWDDVKKQFGNDKEANALLTATYREPWKFPKA